MVVAARWLLHPLAWLVAGMPDRRPWWVYVVRPPFFVFVHAWALPYRIRDFAHASVRFLHEVRQGIDKFTRRYIVDSWREGTKRVRSRTRYALHRVRVSTRIVGARVLRTLMK